MLLVLHFFIYALCFCRYDKLLQSKNPKGARNNLECSDKDQNEVKAAQKDSLSPPTTQQFGVSLQFIKENNSNMVDSIPPVVRQCVEFLSQPDGKYYCTFI